MWKKILISRLGRVIIAGVLACALGAAVILAGNTFRYTEEQVAIPVPGGELAAVITRPPSGAAQGLVIMVHGDAAVTATQDGLYAPWFEGAADAGFATISWSKPGVGGSHGDWLAQSMADRATEVSEVIDWAKGAGFASDTIALWGASQAGWVMPSVVAERTDITGVVAVAPAVNWLRQGRFNLLAELEADGANADQVAAAIAASDATRRLLEADDYAGYLATTAETEPMTQERWEFVRRNLHADATESLQAAAERRVPTHLMLGSSDRNVDVHETAATYQEILGPDLTVATFPAAHSLARPIMEDSVGIGTVTALVWPRALLAPGVIADYTATLRGFAGQR